MDGVSLLAQSGCASDSFNATRPLNGFSPNADIKKLEAGT